MGGHGEAVLEEQFSGIWLGVCDGAEADSTLGSRMGSGEAHLSLFVVDLGPRGGDVGICKLTFLSATMTRIPSHR